MQPIHTKTEALAHMRARGLRVQRLSAVAFKDRWFGKTTSFTDSHHDVKEAVYYYTGGVTYGDLLHELGHMVVWELLGRPQYNNFGCDGVLDATWWGLLERMGADHKKLSTIKTYGRFSLDPCEALTVSVEIALHFQAGRGKRTAFRLLRVTNFLDDAWTPSDVAVVENFLRLGRALLAEYLAAMGEQAA